MSFNSSKVQFEPEEQKKTAEETKFQFQQGTIWTRYSIF